MIRIALPFNQEIATPQSILRINTSQNMTSNLHSKELKSVDDQMEEFRVLFVLKLWWFDENVKARFAWEAMCNFAINRKPNKGVQRRTLLTSFGTFDGCHSATSILFVNLNLHIIL